MKILLIFAALIGLNFASSAQTTIQFTIDAPGTENDGLWEATYNTGTFDSFQASIDDAPWWGNETLAQSFASGADVDNLKFAYAEITFTTPDYALYSDNNTTVGNNGNIDTGTSAIYAVSATKVPAPFPILGILPVAGLLKRMRRRQRSA
jgi:hypothetical protein